MKKLILSFLLLVVFFLVGCGPTTGSTPPMSQPVDASQIPAQENYYCVTPGSDNGKSWGAGAWVCYDTRAYEVTAVVLGDISSNQTVNSTISGYSYNGYGSVSGRTWTDGKGVLPVQIKSIDPAADWLDISLPYILKTSDLGAMGIPAGATVTFICNRDVEVLSPVFSGQTLSSNRVTDELDNCRMKTKNFIPAGQ